MKINATTIDSIIDISPGKTDELKTLAESGKGCYCIEVSADYSEWCDDRCREEVFAMAARLLIPAGILKCPAAYTDNFKSRTLSGAGMEMKLPDKRKLKEWASCILWPGFSMIEPQVFKERLYQHQYNGLKFWDSKGRRALLGHDMGLGKTHAAAWLCYDNVFAEKYKRILVMTLASIIPKWAALLERFAVPYIIIDKETDTLNIPEKTVVLCSFERVRRRQAPPGSTDEEKKRFSRKNLLERLTPTFYRGQFDLFIGDESHKLNKIGNLSVELLSRLLTPETHILLMSGTPFGNGFHEAYPQMNILQKGIFIATTQTDFYNRFCENKSRDPVYPIYRVRETDKPLLFNLIKTKTDFQKIVPGITLPPFTVEDVGYSMNPDQMRLLKQVMKKYMLPLPEGSPAWLTELCPDGIPITNHMQLLHLQRMICSGVMKAKVWIPGQPEEFNDKGYPLTYKFPTEKEGLIKDQMSCMPDHQQTIIWISYTETAKQLHEFLKKEGFNVALIYGKTSAAAKKQTIADFLSGKIQHLISNPGCIGTGLDFINATIHTAYECTYSGIEYEQSRKRSHRITQTMPVTMYRYYGRNSIEKRILKALDEKLDFMSILFGEKHLLHKSDIVMKLEGIEDA